MPELPGPRPPRPDHFPLFDALRGLAAIAVLTYHGVYLPALYNGIDGPWWWRYVMHLDVAVPIFLGISGFLLYRPFVAARLRGKPVPSLRLYGIRRVLRIVPGYWFALTVLTLWFWWQPPGFSEVRSPTGILRFYGFAQIYDADTAIAGIGQAWTLGVEVLFYLALPAWVLLMRRFRPSLRSELVGLAGLIAASIAWKVLVLSHVDPATRAALPYLLPLPTWVDLLAVGMLLAVLSVYVADQRPAWRWVAVVEQRPWVPWAVGLAFWLGACWLAGPDGSVYDRLTDRMYLERHLFYGAFVACLLAPAVFGDPAVGWVRRFLAWRPFAYIGTISFSFYLFHYDVLHQMQHTWGRAPERAWELLPWWVVAMAGSILLGTLGYRLVELPAMRLGHRRAARRRDAVAAIH
jgi:peptidoglycan/LPS O-acetylase OafA/YrhL